MHIVHVFIHVKEDCLDDFRAATIDNASNSIKEPGVVRFDVMQQKDDLTRFVLVEVYRKESDTTAHKETDHYKRWQAAVEPMLISERTRMFYTNVYPDDNNWD